MSMEDFNDTLVGGFQGAGMGSSLLGGLSMAKLITINSNPWIAGGILAAGTGLGILNSMDGRKKREARLNERLGNQEARMNDLNIQSEATKQELDRKNREAKGKFGAMFSNYMAGMAKYQPMGQAAFNQDLGR